MMTPAQMQEFNETDPGKKILGSSSTGSIIQQINTVVTGYCAGAQLFSKHGVPSEKDVRAEVEKRLRKRGII